MPPRLRTVVLACTVCAAGLAGPLAARVRPPDADAGARAEGERIHAHVEFLASDLLEGREAGTRGYDIAARYVASFLELNGLEPAGDDGTFFQRVPLVESTPHDTAITVRPDGQPAVALDLPGEAAVLADHVRETTHVRAPVVFAGFGVTAPQLGYDDYAGLDVTGKAVLVLSSAPRSFREEPRSHFRSLDTKRKNAADHGAAALLVAYLPADLARFPWDRLSRYLTEPAMTWVDASNRPGTGDPRLEAVAVLGPDGLRKVWSGAPVSMDAMLADAAADRVKPIELPITIEIEGATRHRRLTSSNVVARLPGRDPRLADTSVVLTAHLDHTGVGRAVNGDSIYNGAYDNATGSAIVLELVRAFASGPRPRRSIVAVFVTAEEKGLIGSDYFARHPTTAAAGMVAEVNLDMPLLMWPLADVVAWGSENSTLGQVVERAARESGLTVSPDPFPEEHFFVRSDQYSFVKQGVPAAYLVPGLTSADPSVDAKSLFQTFLKTHYHQPSDDASLPMNREAAGRFLRVNERIVELIGDDPRPPSWLPGNFFGVTFGRARELPSSSR